MSKTSSSNKLKTKENEKKKENERLEENKKKKEKNLTFLVVFSVLTGLTSYYIYDLLVTPPRLPELDINHWWGPYPVDADQDISIRPFRITFSDEMIDDLKDRLLRRHPFVPPLEGAGFTYGFNTTFLNQILDYWQNYYEFKDREQFLNKYKHFVTNIQGLDIHYMHIRPNVSSKIKVIPMLILHGWPSSVREFYEIIPKLTKRRSGYDFVFEVIAPSLPGYGFSQAAVRSGLGAAEISVIMQNLMERIGHKKYYIHGGGWGSLISSHMATLFPENILGYHTNTPAIVTRPLAFVYTLLGLFWPSLIVDSTLEHRIFPLSEHLSLFLEESGYLIQQATKPDTVGIAITDSPAGLAAYILEKFSTWTNPKNKEAEDGNLLTKYTLTHLLDNVMIYWSTSSITTSMRVYAETINKRQMALQLDQIPTEVPTRSLLMKYDTFQPPLILKLKYPNYLGHTDARKGGHFPALELPTLLADDIFKAVKKFTQFHSAKRKS